MMEIIYSVWRVLAFCVLAIIILWFFMKGMVIDIDVFLTI